MSSARAQPRERDAAAQLQAIRDVLRAISDAPFDLDAVLHSVCEHAVRLCRADFGYIFLPKGDLYVLAASHGASSDQVAWIREHPIRVDRTTTVGRVALSGISAQIPDVLADPDWNFLEAQSRGPYRAVLSVPIRKEAAIIGVFSLSRVEPGGYAEDEVELVGTFADQAAIAIQNVQLVGTIEHQRGELARYVPTPVVDLISSPDRQALLEGHRREVSVVFCDLRGFTSFAETADPEEVFAVLREYQGEMGQIMLAHHATIEHYAGDAIMCFLNDPLTVPDHTLQAVRMAVAMRDRFMAMADAWAKSGYQLGIGVGIALGYGTVGRVGFEGYFGYAVVGSVANLAARLSAVAEPGQILVSERVRARVDNAAVLTPAGPFDLKGFSHPIGAFAVQGMAG